MEEIKLIEELADKTLSGEMEWKVYEDSVGDFINNENTYKIYKQSDNSLNLWQVNEDSPYTHIMASQYDLRKLYKIINMKYHEKNIQIMDQSISKKLQWTLIDFKALEGMVRALEFGANKYAKDDWKKGIETKKIADKIMRHLVEYLDGNDLDEESGLPHIDHLQANAMYLSYMMKFKPEFDNRKKKQ